MKDYFDLKKEKSVEKSISTPNSNIFFKQKKLNITHKRSYLPNPYVITYPIESAILK